jgi:DnaJ family protein C protein 28
MDFKDWRKAATQPDPNATDKQHASQRYHGRGFSDYIDEQLEEARKRGLFDHLEGMGKPLQLDTNVYAGEKAAGYNLLKSNGFAPAEVELAKEIRQELERLDRQRAILSQRGRSLRKRGLAPFASEKRAYNNAVKQALQTYEQHLRELNSKILTLNLTAPPAMHRSPLQIEQLLEQFQAACPLFL